ncbi:MAG: riboflavin synthase, partial [Pseudomonadota bacterium]
EDMRLTVAPLFDMTDNRTGDSISVNGVCLTVTEIREGAFTVDVSGETLSRSTLGELKMGDEVNLERAVRLSDRLGGHLVSGHVDGVGKIAKKVQQQRSCHLRIGIDEALSKYVVEKGSIAVDGISLTINSCSDEAFEVNIIPETGRVTGLLKKRVGDKVNIETDLIGKYIEKFLFKYQGARQEKGANPISEEMLKKYGFGD